jgi:hypothetical protein
MSATTRARGSQPARASARSRVLTLGTLAFSIDNSHYIDDVNSINSFASSCIFRKALLLNGSWYCLITAVIIAYNHNITILCLVNGVQRFPHDRERELINDKKVSFSQGFSLESGFWTFGPK